MSKPAETNQEKGVKSDGQTIFNSFLQEVIDGIITVKNNSVTRDMTCMQTDSWVASVGYCIGTMNQSLQRNVEYKFMENVLMIKLV